MELALIHNESLILGPIGYNIRMINSELEDLDVVERITSQSYTNIPIHFSDNLTHLVPIEHNMPPYNEKYQNVGNYTWRIIEENNIPIKVLLTYDIGDKTLEEVKNNRKKEILPIRKQKENIIITLTINETEIQIPTTREERILLTSKLLASPGPHNYKFFNTWLEITTEDLQTIISEIDSVVQQAYDWELGKIQEIDMCETIDEVYDISITN